MGCTVKGHKSIFGEAPKITYIYADMIKERLKRNYEVLIVDCLDGLCLMPFARRGLKVYGYETNYTYLYGGQVMENRNAIGLKGRVANENLNNNVFYYNENYYLAKITQQYDFVFIYKSLHKDSNKNISMKEKISKILNSVKDEGYVFIYYYLALDESDYERYPSNQYLRNFEMGRFFNKEWEIIECKEWNKKCKSEDGEYRKGIIFTKKATNIRHNQKYRYHYKINIC